MRVEWYEREVYGKTLLYLVESEVSKAVQRLTGKKTVDRADLEALATLGCELVQVWGTDRRIS